MGWGPVSGVRCATERKGKAAQRRGRIGALSLSVRLLNVRATSLRKVVIKMSADQAGQDRVASAESYLEVQRSPEFQRLRKALRGFVFPMTAAFFLWYLLYVVLSAYARDFMEIKVIGHINVALIFGLLQFATTFLIAWWYSRYAGRVLDPQAEALKAQVENGGLR